MDLNDIRTRGFFAHNRQSSFFCASIQIYTLSGLARVFEHILHVDLSSSLIFLYGGNEAIQCSQWFWSSIDWFCVEMANKVKCFDAFKIFLIEMKCRLPGKAKLSKSTQTVNSYHNFAWKSIIISFLASSTSMTFAPDFASVKWISDMCKHDILPQNQSAHRWSTMTLWLFRRTAHYAD